jgi:RNA polymerase sporulation-specific sigma factor
VGGGEMQYNRVEICGVNTSKLKVLKEKEKMELLRRMHSGDKSARDELINGNLRLVLSVVQRFTNSGENPDDLFQVGCIGLIKAVDNFDINQNVRFSTYAISMIIGEIRRYLRDNNAMQEKEKLVAKKMKEIVAKKPVKVALDSAVMVVGDARGTIDVSAATLTDMVEMVKSVKATNDKFYEIIYKDGNLEMKEIK